MGDGSQWQRLVDEGRQRTTRLASQLRAEGAHATAQVSDALDQLLAGGRRRSVDVQQVLRADLQRSRDALSRATQPVSAAREFASEYVAAAVHLDAFGRRGPALQETIRVEVERQLSERDVVTGDDLRALERRVKSSTARRSTAKTRGVQRRDDDMAAPPTARTTVTTPPL